MSGPVVPRAWTWADAWLIVAIVAPLWVAPGAPGQPIAAAYATKGLVALLVLVPWLALAPRGAPPPARAAAPLLVVAAAFAVAALANPPDRVAEVIDAVLRVALPLAALAVAAGAGSPRAILVTLIAAAAGLAIAVIAEACGGALAERAQARPAALLLHRNNVAFHFAAALPLAAAALAHARGRAGRLAAAAAVVVITAAIVVARSRGAWLAALIGLAPLACLLGRAALLRMVVVVAIVVAGVAASGTGGGLEPLSDRIRGAFDPDGEAAWFERLAIYDHTLDRIHERPLTGWGAGDFATRHARFLGGRPADHPHDDLLTAAYEGGVVAALALGVVLVTVTARSMRRARRTRSPLLAGFAGSLVAWGVLGLVNSPLSLAPSAIWFWLTVGAALGASAQEDSR